MVHPDAPPSYGVAVLADQIFDGEQLLAGHAVLLDGARIRALVPLGEVPADLPRLPLPPGAILAPGFIDWQVNGGGGVLLNDRPDAGGLAAIAAAHRRHGTTGLLPTLITDAPGVMDRLAGVLAGPPPPGVLGLHLEGPFLNPARKGAHPPEHIRPIGPGDLERLAAFARFGRSVVTLAPERAPPGAIETLAAAGLRVSLGHSDALAADAVRAADEGATGVTHLFNAMSQIGPREPGLVGAALDDHRLFVGLIPDGHHVDPVNLRLALRLAGPERLTLVTDAMPSVGAEHPDFVLMGRRVRLAGDRLTMADGTLAVAHLTMMEAVRRMVALAGAPLASALAMASRTPAMFLGLDGERGRIRPGYVADLVAFDRDFTVLATWVAGRHCDERIS